MHDVGTMQCFWADEIVTITIDQFMSYCFGIHDDAVIDHLMIWVNSESDKDPFHIMFMHGGALDARPKFSGVQMVLLLVHITGVKSRSVSISFACLAV